MFPALRRLSLGKIFLDDMSWVNYLYPSLEHLNAPICMDNTVARRFTEQHAKTLFQKNSHIRSLELWKASSELLKFVADKLVSLESLELHNYKGVVDSSRNSILAAEDDVDANKIQFKQLKVLKMQLGQQSFPDNVSCENLAELYINCFPRQTCQKWVEFIEQYKSLKKLHVGHRLKDTIIRKLSNINLKLIEIDLRCDNDVDGSTLVELIKNCTELRKMLLAMPDEESFDSMVKVLKEKFDVECLIEKNGLEISLEKKN